MLFARVGFLFVRQLANTKYVIETHSLVARSTPLHGLSFRLHSPETFFNPSEELLIYVVLDENDFIYVGSSKNLTRRLRSGFASYRFAVKNGKGKNGYRGYKWAELLESNSSKKLTICTCVVPPINGQITAEAVEAELVYLIRQVTGLWPLFQNEIHFSNNKEAATVAMKIWDELQQILIKR